MGKNKDIRKQIEGHQRVIEQHRQWIMYGKDGKKGSPLTIQKWLNDIAKHERIIEKLKAKLP